MKAFVSSAVNKSGKKFAPKAPPRRGAPGPAAPARRPSAAQQPPAQGAHGQQQEREITESLPPPSVSSAEPEPPSIPESAPVVASEAPPAAPTSPKSATPISIPRPIRKPSISKPAAVAQVQPASPSTTLPDTPASPRTLPTETNVLPSIENDTPRSTLVEDSTEVTEVTEIAVPTADTRVLDEAVSPRQSVSEPQPIASAPVAGRSLKWAKKTSEFTNRGRGPVHAVAPPVSSTASSETPGGSLVPVTPEASQASAQGKKRKASKVSDAGRDSERPKRRPRKREPTPEGAEMVEILPNVVKMSELCKDLKTGRKSKRETELRKLELEEQERKQKALEEGSTLESPKKANDSDANKTDRLAAPMPQSGPVMRIVNGEIVLDNASLEVDRHADAARAAGDLEDVVENQLTRKVNQATYGKRTKNESWDEDMTDLFYRGLRMFGTDFMVISKLFPGRSRRQIKLKFNNEERKDPQRIKDTLLGPRETIDITTYSALTNQVYEDPKVIQQELDDEKKRIEEQHEKEKQLHEDLMRNPTGTGVDENAASNGDKSNGAPIKGKRKKNIKNAAGGGTEEVLGSIDDIPMA
ncbi:uncharacterized protein N7496_008011 [Penicillium cataractarum]|uniref:Myb-like domain-containing protein n=1 Tax=Penicillium cataractarum TaxID=2100454 RepID=A0A9W9RXM2_9EURO|nr:uncharacterized protein N7496_008011 [Penicillium cataractarum]KAJ5368251.1 hypothetical protein N7496_008011 [Penicillium cataractarum]